MGGAVNADRKTLGLSDVRPSEAIRGLNEVARRDAKREATEALKQRSGRIIMNAALELGGEFARWKRIVLWSSLGVFAGLVVLLGVLYWRANRTPQDPRVAAIKTQRLLSCYSSLAQQASFAAGSAVSAVQFRGELESVLKRELNEQQQALESQRKARGVVDAGTREYVNLLREALTLRDGYGRSFVFEMRDPKTAVIRSTSSDAPGEEPKSVTISIGPEKPAPAVPPPTP